MTADLSGLTIAHGNVGGVSSLGTLTLSNDTLLGNSGYNGGGVYNGGTLTVTNSTFSGNSASYSFNGYGGGIFNAGTLTVTNSTLAGNSAYSGAGIYNGGTLTVTDSTLSGNSVFPTGIGSGIFNGGTLTLDNTIVAGNTGYDLYGNAATANYSLIQSGAPSNNGTDITGVSPLLGPLGYYGGTTETLPLLPGSPAIGAGSTALIPSGLTTDQRGLSRIVNGAVDIGAVELQITISTQPAKQAGTEGGANAFDLGSFNDANPNVSSWNVDVNWGDGSIDTTFTTASLQSLSALHTYQEENPYAVTVTVTDVNHDSAQASFRATVADVP